MESYMPAWFLIISKTLDYFFRRWCSAAAVVVYIGWVRQVSINNPSVCLLVAGVYNRDRLVGKTKRYQKMLSSKPFAGCW